jgi:MYXO-CTERM domain-containing protein
VLSAATYALQGGDVVASLGAGVATVTGGVTTLGGTVTSTQTVNPFSLASFAPQSFNGSAGSVTSGVGMRLRLSISAGMESSFSGAFSVSSVPAPGAVALAGAAGLLGGRRRR